jgi:hypothetical protein
VAVPPVTAPWSPFGCQLPEDRRPRALPPRRCPQLPHREQIWRCGLRHNQKTTAPVLPDVAPLGGRWRQLSKRARRAQSFCADCGSLEDLQADHSPEAWARKAAGLPIRLQDIDVVCSECNRRRGAARGRPQEARTATHGPRQSSRVTHRSVDEEFRRLRRGGPRLEGRSHTPASTSGCRRRCHSRL